MIPLMSSFRQVTSFVFPWTEYTYKTAYVSQENFKTTRSKGYRCPSDNTKSRKSEVDAAYRELLTDINSDYRGGNDVKASFISFLTVLIIGRASVLSFISEKKEFSRATKVQNSTMAAFFQTPTSKP
jgi:hypothetical protein